MSNQPVNGVPKTPRPQLPFQSLNPYLSMTDTTKPPTVKYQVITREGQEIIVGRLKIQTPNDGHAFVLRRFDTGAISQTTMFRAAFPTAGEDLEKSESAWVKQNYDSAGANGGPGKDKLRLAGLWIRPEVAKELAPAYSLDHIITPLLTAHPDPSQEYRRSQRQTVPQANGVTSSPVKPSNTNPRTDVAPSSPPGSPKPKRRKESSPQIMSPKKAPLETLPPLRRSARVTSPTPIPPPAQALATPTTRTTRTKVAKTPKVTAVPEATGRLTPEEDDYEGSDDVAEVPGPDMHDDIAEQKELIANLKAERESKEATASEDVSAVPIKQSDSQGSKRAREEEGQPLKFEFREPDEQNAVANREIKSNRRLSLDLEPQQKSAAWGALWFAAGLAAAATIPSFFM
ncbi:uncharacterized protein FOMMEDRAFT_138422 [Fomitiporia mediterranea MF3/22]|uniref:uncharacterized protein n=1 Tax=Fomitiporia mediterranea (strain MF3/22) TaxID=694068 RepID=UPI0004409944|nr:uncharacterized protein FOMMEDRAFT_138422 [Fomitiporia mediterranea MF3/22]EJD06464.1 hypothetical protein FOMMEDRAFT_138422 [Fomitiporia mediterranea MF3/22]